MVDYIIARWGEIHLKGANRGFFLRALKKNLEATTGAHVKIEGGRAIITGFDDADKAVTAAANTFGIVSVSPVAAVESDEDAILEYLGTLKIEGTFKVEVNRANKQFPHKSNDFAAIAGGVIDAPVDVHNPRTVVSIDIREKTYIYSCTVDGAGGLPVGTAGRALCLLSGGIDSPVAAYLAAKRGLSVDCIHFASPPYTSDFALEKVKDLARKLEKFCGKINLYVVPFTEIQEAIRKNCSPEFMITIMRRFMIRIAERIALDNKTDCIITGESLGQVASQTVAGIASNNYCARVLPILRPLVTYDKREIVALAQKIGTYETSCRPYPDCCTVFVPKHPSISPSLKKVEISEAKLDVEALINRARGIQKREK
jgi:thiamine biosynthesis protein ThiI